MNSEMYRKIIQDAIGNEIEANVFYRSVCEKVSDPDLKATFGELAAEENGHREFLEGLLAKPAGGLHFDEVKDYGVSNTIERPALTIGMAPVDGLKLAIKKEEDAMMMYKGLSAASGDAGMKAMFDSLANMETAHKARLEDIYTNSAFVESW